MEIRFPNERRALYLPLIMAEIFADKEVKETCLRALRHAREAGRPFDTSDGAIDTKSFLPCLRQLYLLANAPFEVDGINESVVVDLSNNSKYGPAEKLRQYYLKYGGYKLPMPFIRKHLKHSLDIAEATADKMIKTLIAMEMARPMPCDFDAQAQAIEIGEELLHLVETWTGQKHVMCSMRLSDGQ